jgi:DNA polymerase III subunit epsilon
MSVDTTPRWQEIAIPPEPVAGCDAIVIDFETASGAYHSACAIGLVWLSGFIPVARAFRLIRPPDNLYSPFNIGIHGIRPDDTETAPDFAGLWQDLAPHLSGTLLVAHNARFDAGVLRRTLVHYGIEMPTPEFLCTVVLARQFWPGLVNHRLPTVAAHLGYRFSHHHALEDAEAAAEVLRAAGEIAGVASPRALIQSG